MIFPATRLTLSGERFTVHYRLVAGGEAEAEAIARGICLEQTVEVSDKLLADDDIRGQVVGRIEALARCRAGPLRRRHQLRRRDGGWRTHATAQRHLRQFGHAAGDQSPAPRPAPSLLQQFKGPRFGRDGLRALLGVADRPLLGTALKPMGLSAVDLAEPGLSTGAGRRRHHQGRPRPDRPAVCALRRARAPLRRGGRTGQSADRLSLSLCAQRDRAGRSHSGPCPAGQGLGRGRHHGGAGPDRLGHAARRWPRTIRWPCPS